MANIQELGNYLLMMAKRNMKDFFLMELNMDLELNILLMKKKIMKVNFKKDSNLELEI